MTKTGIEDFLLRFPFLHYFTHKVVGLIPRKVRLGQSFWRWYAFFEESEQWKPEEILSFQMERLQALLLKLQETSPFYRARLSGIDIAAITSLDEFRKNLPELDRTTFRDRYSEIQADGIGKGGVKASTSGTTGEALQFFHPRGDSAREWAAICHQWKRIGYQPGVSRRAEFRGLTVHGRSVDIYPASNMLRCSILHLDEGSIRHYAEEIRRFKVDYLHGYPSALYLVAREIVLHGIDFPQPKGILLASEMVNDWQLTQISEAFPGSKLFAHYGCAERTVLAGWCEHNREYHILPQYSIVEVDPETSEVIGTNLYNNLNGFVRYRMTDTVGEVRDKPCPDCGRPYSPRFVGLAGRTEDYLFSPQNGWIPPAIVTYPLKDLNVVNEMQFLQKERDELNVRYSLRSDVESSQVEAELDLVREGMHRLFGKDMKLHFERVAEFPRGPTGKFKWIISELDELDDGRHL